MGDHPRDRILEATRTLVGRNSAARTVTIGEVAAEAHVSRATVYRYFPDKTALLQTACATDAAASLPVDPRARILEAALDVFGERGLHAASLAEIASRAGLTLSGLHWHFRNKDELIAGVAEAIPVMPAILAEAVRAEHADADLEAQLTRIAAAALRFIARRRPVLRLIIFETGIHPDVARLARVHTIGRFLPMLTTLFERHAERGTLRPGPARARAQAFMGMLVILGLLRPTFDDLLEPDDEATAREYVQIIMRGVLAAPEGGLT
ncbi:MAG: TetR/AcrR family transcriptional regulator [Chloroflexota bacterium]